MDEKELHRDITNETVLPDPEGEGGTVPVYSKEVVGGEVSEAGSNDSQVGEEGLLRHETPRRHLDAPHAADGVDAAAAEPLCDTTEKGMPASSASAADGNCAGAEADMGVTVSVEGGAVAVSGRNGSEKEDVLPDWAASAEDTEQILSSVTLADGPGEYDAFESTGLAARLSRGISMALHPFMIPIYMLLVLLYGDTVMANISPRLKWFFIGMVALNTLVIPAIFISLMRTLGVLGDLSLRHRRERLLPLAVVAVCYVVCIFMVSDILVAFLIRKFLFTALGCVLLALAVTFYWKISLHLIALGGAIATLMLMAVSGFGSLMGVVAGAVVLAGLLSSARLYLGSHNPAQVAAGFFGGFAVAALVMLLF